MQGLRQLPLMSSLFALQLCGHTILGTRLWLASPPNNEDSYIDLWYGRDPYDRSTLCFDLVQSYLSWWAPTIWSLTYHEWSEGVFRRRYRGVSLTCYCCWPIRLLLIFLDWFEGLELPASLFLVEPLVTKTYWDAAQTSSSSIEYLSAHLNRSSIVVGSFFARDSKNGVPELMFCLKICRMASLLQDSTWSIAYPNRFMKSLSDLFSYNLIFYKVLMFCFWQAKHR